MDGEDKTAEQGGCRFHPRKKGFEIKTLHLSTELGKNIPPKFRDSLSKCSAARPKIALWRNISDNHSPNLAGMFLHFSVDCPGPAIGMCGAQTFADNENGKASIRYFNSFIRRDRTIRSQFKWEQE